MIRPIESRCGRLSETESQWTAGKGAGIAAAI
jgi:hypothetical protein